MQKKNSLTKELNSAELNPWRTEWINNHRRMKQYTINAQYSIISDCPTMKLRRNPKGQTAWSPRGDYRIESTKIRWFSDSQAGRLHHKSSDQRQLREPSRGTHPVQLQLRSFAIILPYWLERPVGDQMEMKNIADQKGNSWTLWIRWTEGVQNPSKILSGARRLGLIYFF